MSSEQTDQAGPVQPGSGGSQAGQARPGSGGSQAGQARPGSGGSQVGATQGRPGESQVGATQAEAGAAADKKDVSGNSTLRALLHILAAALIILGISLPVDSSGVLWSASAAWAGLATLAAIAQAAALLGPKEFGGRAWLVGAVAAGVLVLIWTLIMLPQISSNMAFMVTLGTGCAVAGVLLSPAAPADPRR